MNFKILSQNNIGVAVLLLLAVVLSQSRVFDYMVNTVLGRALFIAILVFLSYIHRMLGVVCMLLIVILFSMSNVDYLEGFSSQNSMPSTYTQPPMQQAPTMQAPAVSTPATIPIETLSSPATSTSIAKEGFDIVGKERNIQKGRNSNSIPVNDFMRESTNVAPYEGAPFHFSEFTSQ